MSCSCTFQSVPVYSQFIDFQFLHCWSGHGTCYSAQTAHKPVKISSAKQATSDKSLLFWYIYCGYTCVRTLRHYFSVVTDVIITFKEKLRITTVNVAHNNIMSAVFVSQSKAGEHIIFFFSPLPLYDGPNQKLEQQKLCSYVHSYIVSYYNCSLLCSLPFYQHCTLVPPSSKCNYYKNWKELALLLGHNQSLLLCLVIS